MTYLPPRTPQTPRGPRPPQPWETPNQPLPPTQGRPPQQPAPQPYPPAQQQPPQRPTQSGDATTGQGVGQDSGQSATGQHRADPEQGYGQPGGYGESTGYVSYGAYGQQQRPYPQPGYGTEGPDHYGEDTRSEPWNVTTRSGADAAARDSGAVATLIALGMAVLFSLVYAVWAFTARRSVFANFSNGVTVTSDDAKSSDNMDTFLLIITGLLIVFALALWVMRKVNQRTSGGTLDLAGFVVTGVGVLVVLVGLFLSSGISDASDQAAQGDKGVTATLVTGGGFVIIAVGLVLGILAVRAGTIESASSGYTAPGSVYPTW